MAEPRWEMVSFVHERHVPTRLIASMRAELAACPSVRLRTVELPPGPTVAIRAAWLGELLSDLPRAVPLHLVGHDEAGVVCRYYAQRFRDGRLVQTISLASPFRGQRGGEGGGSGDDLSPDSSVLRDLAATARRRLGLPHLSVVIGADGADVSPTQHHHALPAADVALLRCAQPLGGAEHSSAARVVVQRVLHHATARGPIDGMPAVW